jgi:hypothetical protein
MYYHLSIIILNKNTFFLNIKRAFYLLGKIQDYFLYDMS